MESRQLKQVRIGLCGLGTVGAGTVNILQNNLAEITARSGCNVSITHIGARRENPLCNTGSIKISSDIFAVADDANVDILIELIGGTDAAYELVKRAIANGKHVVTANKALIAKHGNELFALAHTKGVTIAFEAAVAGGIPIIKALREGLAANRIEWLAGIINGTSNFILTEMRDKGRAFDDVLQEAQALGYAEVDPTFDVGGMDAGHKLVILASIAFGMPLNLDALNCEGITDIQPDDVRYAEELGYRIKSLGIARRTANGIELRVHPTLIPAKRLIANVHGVMNAILVKGNAVGPTLYYGPGAGSLPTASSVVADIIDIARSLDVPLAQRVPYLGVPNDQLKAQPILPMSEVETAYYLRMSAHDKPGVLSKIAQILSDAGISIEALIQKEPQEGHHQVPLIILTNRTLEKKMNAAVAQIEALNTIEGKISRMRVESLEG
jgi:homoserine dehydrogenase